MNENTKANALAVGSILRSEKNTYIVEKVLGAGGFGITYLVSSHVKVQNIRVKAYFAVKEHFLSEVSERDGGTSGVRYLSSVKDKWDKSLRDFISEARRLSSFGEIHDNIVKVNEVFMANNTAYYVMQYVEGQSLTDYIKTKGQLNEQETLELMTPIIRAVGELHKVRLTHLDIKPDNIMLERTENGINPILIDFGLAKHYEADGSPTSSINTLGYSNGFSPIEQYAGITTFSPTADIYALGATLYNCLTGNAPQKAVEVLDVSAVSAPLSKVASETVVSAVCHAMVADLSRRTQTVSQLLTELKADGCETSGTVERTDDVISESGDKTESVATPSDHIRLKRILFVIIGLICVVIVGSLIVSQGKSGNATDTDSTIENTSDLDVSPVVDEAMVLHDAMKLDDNGDYAQAVYLYVKLAEQGNADAQCNLGYCYECGNGVAQSWTEAVKWYRKSAEQGLARAQFNLGVCYENGNGVAQSWTEAVKWYRKSAEQGNAGAQCNLGWCYENGKGVAQSYAEAVKWYRKSVEQGNAGAQYNLGVCYAKGQGVAQSYAEAVKWYRKSAEQGDADAQFDLGGYYENGQGVAQSWTEAVKWYRKSAEQGNAGAQNNLGSCYWNGTGVAQNKDEAVRLWRLAAQQGEQSAKTNLKTFGYSE